MTRPFVTVHFAQSLDGHVDDCAGPLPLRLSNEEGFLEAHRARATNDAVLVGIGTVQRDDPRLLTSRVSGKSPDRVVLDSSLRTPLDARLLAPTPGTRTIIIGSESQAARHCVAPLVSRGALVYLLQSATDGRVPIRPALALLAELGIERLLVEGGPRVIQSFLRAECVDRLNVEIVPKVVGSTGLSGLGTLLGSVVLEQPELLPLGSHVLLRGTPCYKSGAR